MVILLTSIPAVSFGKGGGGGGGGAGGGMGSDGGVGIGSDDGHGMGGKGHGNNVGNPDMTQSRTRQENIDIFKDFFKNLDAFEITDTEETNLIENSWND